jgi:glycosyltransferase involved in cell wall biosynthesis
MKKPRCLVIYPIDSTGKKYGGIETTIRSYVKSLPQMLEIEIIGISVKNGPLQPGRWYDITLDGRQVRFFPVLEVEDPNDRTLIPLILKFTIALFLRRRKINFNDCIIMFHRLEPAYVLSDIRSKKILFLHGNIPQYLKDKYSENRWKGLHKIYFFIEPFFIKQMSRIFVVSQAACTHYKEKYRRTAQTFKFMRTWYNPETIYREEGLCREEIISQYDLPLKKVQILFVGRLELPKNPDLLIKVFKEFNQHYPESVLIIIGDGKLSEQVELLISKLNLEGAVFIIGRQSQKAIVDLMNVSDVMLMTSAIEGMPRVAMESRPVVCRLSLPMLEKFILLLKMGNQEHWSIPMIPGRSPRR